MEQQFIKNILSIDVNGFTGSIRYVIRKMYDEIHEDGFATIEQKIIKDMTLTREEIEKRGGHQEIIKQLREQYAPLEIF